MGHRDLPSNSQLFDINQDENPSHRTAGQAHIYAGSTSAPDYGPLIYQMESISTNEPYSDSRHSFESRSTADSSANFRAQVSASPLGPSHDSFPHITSGGGIYQAPENNDGNSHSNRYNMHTIHEAEDCPLGYPMGSGRGPFKRKRHRFNESSSSSRFCSAGSSSSSLEFQPEKPISDHQYQPSGNTCLPYYRGDCLSMGSEDTRRNVRSRSRLDLELHSQETYLSNSAHDHHPTSSSYHTHSTPHLSNCSGTVDSTNLNAYEENCTIVSPASHGTFQTSGNHCLRHQMNQQYVQGSANIDGLQHDSSSSRNHISHPRHHRSHNARTAREIHCNSSHRQMPLNRAPSSSRWRHREASSFGNHLRHQSENSSRYTRPLNVGSWHNNFRDTRSRIDTERFHPLTHAVDAHNEMGSEALVVDRSHIYSSRNLFDQYGDMSLDIDHMSYEELLALGESIGSVSTGLSEDVMSKCLMVTTYCSDKTQEEVSCAICLEQYQNRDKVGTIDNCGHDYHAACIKKWLSMKNACPICKEPALSDDSKKD
ncbi:hypothetical protein HS088_TW21G01675 [Tripterygium wilfordii]|uniref:RING-type E3 ubiquitin transferase n=1 Tax=Tripterygium wilfordii TaxID=458696 RepID=A0A7J7C5X7_TRIWF|nr:probable E3 ubiquitin-protein ligase ZFP1 [Tripterygium wilfordii]XP_038689039.1 probable E3 ubiquitin-protein ligase ZFP1 [Tripterygium wilfordii]XP_038689041.1 probable E3 ubiquitin-protein ligase ZFP1 [Tripterygium wilfordii]XP_038689042.1 probable E3 ubiquitin-protein ligase ZFP1 [Tripterygium wilfordii]XP_038689043.1 probable E3 ubiquitin-protein ligase ZFP1 [Tripterygium wilfordii]XP_038689044.1 probable E3 ubiquitin-protein ligase ZFP1 [Tripterygium wilfordii]XP_038689045.1 probable